MMIKIITGIHCNTNGITVPVWGQFHLQPIHTMSALQLHTNAATVVLAPWKQCDQMSL
jgi:hypothetical protein